MPKPRKFDNFKVIQRYKIKNVRIIRDHSFNLTEIETMFDTVFAINVPRYGLLRDEVSLLLPLLPNLKLAFISGGDTALPPEYVPVALTEIFRPFKEVEAQRIDIVQPEQTYTSYIVDLTDDPAMMVSIVGSTPSSTSRPAQHAARTPRQERARPATARPSRYRDTRFSLHVDRRGRLCGAGPTSRYRTDGCSTRRVPPPISPFRFRD